MGPKVIPQGIGTEEKQPEDRVLGQEIPGTSGTHTSGYP